jgi:methionine synthase II (cobalamin-independent)
LIEIRADQVGSLLRPPELLDARAAFAEKRLSLDELRSIEDRAIEQALGKQREIGIDVVTDGEMREARDELRRRIDQAGRYLPLEQLAISTQCGFASTAPGNPLSMDEQWRKLSLVVETARETWR